MSMTKHKHKTHNYKENEIVFKKWFRTDILIKEFDALDDVEKRTQLCTRLGITHNRAIEMSKPDCVISWSTADKYAIRLGYHPCIIWPDWFHSEPEEGSNLRVQKKKQIAKESNHNVDTDTNQL